jgi:hypothetical protein
MWIHREEQPAHLKRLRKKSFPYRGLTSAAKAEFEDKAVIAAVNRCATQNQVQHQNQVQYRSFPQPLKGGGIQSRCSAKEIRHVQRIDRRRPQS